MSNELAVRDEVYGGLAAAVVEELQARAERVRGELKRTSEGILNIGQELVGARETLAEEGRFVAWLDLEFGMSRASAYRFINVAERFSDISQIENIGPSVLYMLAAPGTSDQVVEAALEMSAEGEPPAAGEVQRLRAADEALRSERAVWDHTAEEVRERAEELQEAELACPVCKATEPDLRRLDVQSNRVYVECQLCRHRWWSSDRRARALNDKGAWTLPPAAPPKMEPQAAPPDHGPDASTEEKRPAPVMRAAEPPPLRALDMAAVIEARQLAPGIEATVRVQPGQRYDPGRVCIVSVWEEGGTPVMHRATLGELGTTVDMLVWELIRQDGRDEQDSEEQGGQNE